MIFFQQAAYRYLSSRDANNTVWQDCRYTPHAYYTGSVDVGNEICPQSLLRDRQFTRSLAVGTQSGRYFRWLFVSKLEAAMFFCSSK